MNHRLISNIEAALGWNDATDLGTVAHGTLPDTDLPARLLTPEDLLDLFTRSALGLPRIRLVRDGADIPEIRYTSALRNRRGPSIPVVDLEQLHTQLAAGVTLVADAVHSSHPTIELATRAMSWWCDEIVGVNAYLTTGATTGFDMHFDDHDVIIIQLAGTKAWDVRGQSRPNPMYRDSTFSETPSTEILFRGDLNPGDVLHIPRGHWHQASRADHAANASSLHLTFGLRRRTWVDWLGHVADQSRVDDDMRADLPPAGHDDALLETMRAKAIARLQACSPADMRNRERSDRPPARHLHTGDMFDTPSAVIAITEFTPDLEISDSAVVVRAAGKQLTFAPTTLPIDRVLAVLRALLSGQPVKLDHLTQQTGINVATIATRLIEEGLCAQMTASLWSGCTDLIPTWA